MSLNNAAVTMSLLHFKTEQGMASGTGPFPQSFFCSSVAGRTRSLAFVQMVSTEPSRLPTQGGEIEGSATASS